MIPEELRIGNFVKYDEEDEIFEVTGITQMFNDEPYDLNLRCADGMFTDMHIEETKPIKLSEAWLLNFGWKYQDRDINTKDLQRFYISDHFGKHNEYWIEMNLPGHGFNHCFIWLHWDIGSGKNFIHLPYGQDIKYVHQLQNMYFILSGKELQLKKSIKN